MTREERNRVGYAVAVVSEFARAYKVEPRQAYAYLKRWKGTAHLAEHYGVLHTMSLEDAVEVLAEVCQNNGGELK